jgi:hypothetical protein
MSSIIRDDLYIYKNDLRKELEATTPSGVP